MSVDEIISRGYVDAAPVKSFFVSMLTRDIPLQDAILDLLDNCVDGIVRSHLNATTVTPYQGFVAKIEFDKDSFTISDNCGGIPTELLEYAFRLGRPDERANDSVGSVGVYGIGMKRAIFKMGEKATISTENSERCFDISISPEWINNATEWNIPIRERFNRHQAQNGTVIKIENLVNDISSRFGDDVESFTEELERRISTQYSFIIAKGFSVVINGVVVKPQPTRLLFSDSSRESIKPYIYKTQIDEVDVFVTVGFTEAIPSSSEIENDQEETRFRSIDAGWTIVCNDRAVVYRDRTELTGWGEAGVPSYHTQFIAIAGIVEFKSNDPKKLPTTTTKRGIDSSSQLYLQVKNRMREGMKIFTAYTNKWKGDAESTKSQFSETRAMSLAEIKVASDSVSFNATHNTRYPGQQYKPNLPMPAGLPSNEKRVTFKVPISEFKTVADFLTLGEDAPATDVGLLSFKYVLKKAL